MEKVLGTNALKAINAALSHIASNNSVSESDINLLLTDITTLQTDITSLQTDKANKSDLTDTLNKLSTYTHNLDTLTDTVRYKEDNYYTHSTDLPAVYDLAALNYTSDDDYASNFNLTESNLSETATFDESLIGQFVLVTYTAEPGSINGMEEVTDYDVSALLEYVSSAGSTMTIKVYKLTSASVEVTRGSEDCYFFMGYVPRLITIENLYKNKVDKSSLATINGQSLLDGGDITISGGSADGLATVATTGSYNDLTDLPAIITDVELATGTVPANQGETDTASIGIVVKYEDNLPYEMGGILCSKLLATTTQSGFMSPADKTKLDNTKAVSAGQGITISEDGTISCEWVPAKYYTGSTAPSSSVGSDNDLYLQIAE